MQKMVEVFHETFILNSLWVDRILRSEEVKAMRIKSFIYLAVLFSMLIAAPLFAQQDSHSETEWSEQALLGDILRIKTPIDTKREDLKFENIMGTAPDQNGQTRLRIPIEDTEMVIQARQFYALAPRDMSGALSETPYFENFDGSTREKNLELGGGWSAFVVFPEKYTYWPGTYLLGVIWIKDPDDRLHEIAIASWQSETHYGRLTDLANDIVDSLHPGKKGSTLPNDIVVLDSEIVLGKGDSELVVTLGGKHQLSRRLGVDFVVHDITSLAPLGENSAHMGIYLGHHPSFDEAHEIRNGAIRSEGDQTVLGEKPVWLVRQSEDSLEQDLLMDLMPGETDLKLHIYLSGPTDEVKDLVKIAHTLELRSKR